MKILYAVQGTGNGHISRAMDIIPILRRKADSLDIVVSGTQADIQLPYPVSFRFKGLSLYSGKTGAWTYGEPISGQIPGACSVR